MKFKTHTLGCKVNQYETQAMEELLLQAGYEKAEEDEVADIYIINTCTVTALADSKSRQFISRGHRENPEAMIVAVGCYVQVSPESIADLPGVQLMIGTKDRDRIVDLIEEARIHGPQNHVESIKQYRGFDPLDIQDTEERTRAFMKVQDGCDRYCSYCKIPYARGPVRSRDPEDIYAEAKRLGERGFKEIVLTGIHIASYDRDSEVPLEEVITNLAQLDEIKRIRTSSMDPMWITEERLNRLAETKKFCDHFHLSLQSGSNEILKKMNRRYTREEYLEKVVQIRKVFPNAGITTDIIAGFPGEGEAEFQDSFDIIEEAGFARVHVFPYSNREGTAASRLPDQLPKTIKQKRSSLLRREAARVQRIQEDLQIGKILEVLVEESDQKSNASYGYSTNYFRVRIDSPHMLENEIVRVKIDGKDGSTLLGKELTDGLPIL